MKHSRAQVFGQLASGSQSMQRGTPVGAITRGTTGINRLRRVDRWTAHRPAITRLLRDSDDPLAVDLGYGSSHVTTVEMARWLRKVRADVRVIGLEIAPERVLEPREGVEFRLGGFELAGLRPVLVRAFNVLRQYSEDDVAATWDLVTSSLAPGGLLVEGTCDELGRRASWVEVDASGPRSLTLCWSPNHVERPSELAERLPKALIHRNVPGEPIHALLAEADRAWAATSPWAPFGPRQRWLRAHELLRCSGTPLEPLASGLRDNLLTIPWSALSSG